jgi:hypothetical protein
MVKNISVRDNVTIREKDYKRERVFLQIIDEILFSLSLTERDRDFARKALFTIFIDMIEDGNLDKVLKNILYMHKEGCIGQFALFYRNKLLKYIKSRDEKKLQTLIELAYTPEYDDNNFFDEDDIIFTDDMMNREILSLNLAIDTALYNSSISSILFYIPTCREEVCQTTHMNGKINNLLFLKDEINTMCFPLSTLLFILLTNRINPYTNEKWSDKETEEILSSYPYETKLIKRRISKH